MSTVRIFVGIFSLTAVSALSLMWGNLSVYTSSYFYFRVHEEVTLDTSWVVAANTAAWSVGLMLCKNLTDLFGFRKTMAAGIIVFNGSMFLCVLAVERSFLAFTLAFGVCCGFSAGVLQAQQLILVTMWSKPQYLGLGCGGILCFQQISAVFMNVAVTYFINPDNLRPDAYYLNAKLFSQPEVLDRVPKVFIVHGIVALSLGIISFLFVKVKPTDDTFDDDTVDDKSKSVLDRVKSDAETYNSATPEDTHSDKRKIQTNHMGAKNTDSKQSNTEISETTRLKHLRESSNTKDIKETKWEDHSKTDSSDVTPKQALKTTAFYALLILAVHTDITFIILSTYYKMFGMLYYPDDHFFTNTSVALNGGSFIVVALAGFICDKLMLKSAIIVNSSLLCLLSGSFSTTVLVNKWLYFVCVVLCAGSVNANYLMTTIGMMKYFGKSHSTTLYGMAMSVSVVTNTVTPPFIHYILSTFGWLTIYTTVGVINLIGLIVVVIGLPVLKGSTKSSKDEARELKEIKYNLE